MTSSDHPMMGFTSVLISLRVQTEARHELKSSLPVNICFTQSMANTIKKNEQERKKQQQQQQKEIFGKTSVQTIQSVLV